MANTAWTGTHERRRAERRRTAPAGTVPAAFLVQLIASHAGIGPFATRDLATPLEAARRYREAAGAGVTRRA
jgi:hypothetical protein